MNTYEIATSLVQHGTVDFHNGILRFHLSPDEHTTINDYECYGKVEPVTYNRDLGVPNERPTGFDGLAQIITTVFGDRYWWQPTPSLWGLTNSEWVANPKHVHDTRNVVQDILAFGFKNVTVEYCEGADAYNRPIVRGVGSVSGVEPFTSDSDTADVLADLIDEALVEAGVLV